MRPGRPAIAAPAPAFPKLALPAPRGLARRLPAADGIAWTIGRRLLSGILTLFVVSLLVFLAGHAMPGDQAVAILGRNATPQTLAALRHQLGLDHSLVTQYVDWLKGVFHGSLGQTTTPGQSVAGLVGDRLPNTLLLLAVVAAAMIPLGLLTGSLAAWRAGRAFDRVVSVTSIVAIALPEFVVAVALIYLLATTVFPVLPPVSVVPPGESVLDEPKLVVLPALTLVIVSTPYLTRMVRAMMIEVNRSDYVEMARLKGVPERRVIARHALPNAIAPAAQVIALILAFLAGGEIVVEAVFAYPGIGLALIDAIRARDAATLQAIGLLIAGAYVVLTLIADLIALAATPQLRTRGQG